MVDFNLQIIQFASEYSANNGTEHETPKLLTWQVFRSDLKDSRNYWGWAYVSDWAAVDREVIILKGDDGRMTLFSNRDAYPTLLSRRSKRRFRSPWRIISFQEFVL